MYGELAYGEKGKKSSANPDKCQALEGIYDHQVTFCTAQQSYLSPEHILELHVNQLNRSGIFFATHAMTSAPFWLAHNGRMDAHIAAVFSNSTTIRLSNQGAAKAEIGQDWLFLRGLESPVRVTGGA